MAGFCLACGLSEMVPGLRQRDFRFSGLLGVRTSSSGVTGLPGECDRTGLWEREKDSSSFSLSGPVHAGDSGGPFQAP